MKHYLLYIPALLLLMAACTRDKGNYDYTALPDPEIGLDTLYKAVTGDSLIIDPKITLHTGKNDYSCHWNINIPAEGRGEDHDGQVLRIVFGLPASRYATRLTVTDNNTGMKYFYNFFILGQTEFSQGLVVLSTDNNNAVLSMIKPDGSVKPDLYQAINNEALPGPALQLVPIQNQFYLNTLSSFWITHGGDQKGGVLLDAGTLKRLKYLPDNFFEPPGDLKPGYFMNMINGITNAVINGKLFIGSDETAPFWPYYGYFGVPVTGVYNLASPVLNNISEARLRGKSGYYLGFDPDKKAFLRFFSNTFYGTDYEVQGNAFDPTNIKMNMTYLARFNDNEIYAICDSIGKKVELRFRLAFSDSTKTFYPAGRREFPGAAKLTAGTVWETSPTVSVMFFSANDVIYRYNPLNNDLQPLATTTGGKPVSMLRVQHGGDLLIVGAEGSIYYLDTSVGRNGTLIKKVDGIPGVPRDVILRD
ncbi:hypothetical protein F0L74_29975 [Chitinophaga agrisoli]|uniref:PKD family protein n=1 Tax=Chitinophaga agrisoli TaxID=2607653 RepID=A0A5B2VMZ9_9BACT|nr:PKD-like family lipoprotein [Chitinophaga agrisoli]KAA2240385.1 hypothetical protein F0L74_29975 [Chitinophaga agrisoli]